MKKSIMLLSLFLLFMAAVYSQTELGVDYRYSVGKEFSQHAFGGSYEGFSVKNSWTLGVNYNLSSFGSGKESGKGYGFGISAGYRHGFSYGTSGNLFGGLQLSLASDKNKDGKSFTVFTPSIEGGYHYTFNNFGQGGFTIPSIGIGYNMNINKEKEAPDQATVFHGGISVGYRF